MSKAQLSSLTNLELVELFAATDEGRDAEIRMAILMQIASMNPPGFSSWVDCSEAA